MENPIAEGIRKLSRESKLRLQDHCEMVSQPLTDLEYQEYQFTVNQGGDKLRKDAKDIVDAIAKEQYENSGMQIKLKDVYDGALSSMMRSFDAALPVPPWGWGETYSEEAVKTAMRKRNGVMFEACMVGTKESAINELVDAIVFWVEARYVNPHGDNEHVVNELKRRANVKIAELRAELRAEVRKLEQKPLDSV